jgi:hypothetical protein
MGPFTYLRLRTTELIMSPFRLAMRIKLPSLPHNWLIFVGLALVAGAIMFHATANRYAIASSNPQNVIKLDTHTGQLWLCFMFKGCGPIENPFNL